MAFDGDTSTEASSFSKAVSSISDALDIKDLFQKSDNKSLTDLSKPGGANDSASPYLSDLKIVDSTKSATATGDTTAAPADTTAKPADTTVAPAADTTAKPADTTVAPAADTTAKPAEGVLAGSVLAGSNLTNDITTIKSPDGSVAEGIGPIKVEREWDWSHPLDSAWHKLTDKTEQPPEAPTPTEAPKDHDQEKAKLGNLADDKLKDDPAKLKEFKDNMEKVETRQPALSNEEKAALYSQESRLLDAKGDQPTNEKQRQDLAEEIMKKAADPTDIHQGYHGTCQVASVEARMYTRDPSKAAELVADLAIKGEHTLPDGKVLKVPADQLQPDKEVNKPYANFANRDYASQIFQEATVNTYLLEHGYKGKDVSLYPNVRDVEYKPGDVAYRHVPPTKDNPTGEVLVDVSDPANPTEIKYTNPGPPGVTGKDLPEVYGLISGKPNDSMPTLENSAVDPEAKEGKDVIHVKSEADLQRIVKEAKEQGKLPMFVAVDTGLPPFNTDSGGKAGGDGGGHAVLITDIHDNPPPKGVTVEIQNPWGKDASHFGDNAVPIGDLWNAMGMRTQITMDNEVKQLKDACGTLGNDNDKIFNALENKTPTQLAAMDQDFQNHNSGMTIERYLEQEMKRHPEELKRALKALKDGGIKLEHPELAA